MMVAQRKDKVFRLCNNIGSGGTPDSGNPDYYDGEIRWVQTGDLNDGLLAQTEKTINKQGLDSSSAKIYPAGTLLIAMYGATIGKMGILEFSAATNQACCAMNFRSIMDTKYMFYKFLDIREPLISQGYGGGQQNISQEIIKQTYIFFPLIDEQRRIAAYLDKTCSAIDTAIEKKQKQLETLDALRKSIIHKAVTRGLDDSVELKDSGVEWIGKIPAKWKLIAIKRIVSTKITDGPHETPELSDEGIQFISAEAIKNNQIDFNLRRGFISSELHQQYCCKCKPQKRDLFIVKSGATTGNVAYVDVDFEFSIWSPLALVRCDEYTAFYKFIYYVLLTDVFRKQVELSWSFGTQQNIGMRVIERIKLPIPPVEEQKNIAAFLDDETLRVSEIRANIESQISTLTAYRKSLIHECVTGKRRITEEGSAGHTSNLVLT